MRRRVLQPRVKKPDAQPVQTPEKEANGAAKPAKTPAKPSKAYYSKSRTPGHEVSTNRQAQALLDQRLALERAAVALKAAGYDVHSIAEELGLQAREIPTILKAGLTEYHEDRNKAAEHYLSLVSARIDRLLRVWWPRATGFTEHVKDEETGEMVEMVHPPDLDAAKLVAAINRDSGRLFGLQKIRVELTGRDGGPIAFSNSDWDRLTPDELERVASGETTVRALLTERGAGASEGTPRDPEEEDGGSGTPTRHH